MKSTSLPRRHAARVASFIRHGFTGALDLVPTVYPQPRPKTGTIRTTARRLTRASDGSPVWIKDRLTSRGYVRDIIPATK